MKIKYSRGTPSKGGHRIPLTLTITTEDHVLRKLSSPVMIATETTIPVTLYQHDGDIITKASRLKTMFKGAPLEIKAFMLRLAAVDSWNKKARLNVPIPCEMQLGFVEPSDWKQAEVWLQTISDELNRLAPAALAAQIEKINAPTEAVVIESEHSIAGVEHLEAESSRKLR